LHSHRVLKLLGKVFTHEARFSAKNEKFAFINVLLPLCVMEVCQQKQEVNF